MTSKTIREALIDEIHYPISVGFADNKLLMRGLDAEAPFTIEVARSPAFVGATADCLASLITAPNFSESDKSVSFSRDVVFILGRANALYRSLGEPELLLESARPQPTVTILS